MYSRPTVGGRSASERISRKGAKGAKLAKEANRLGELCLLGAFARNLVLSFGLSVRAAKSLHRRQIPIRHRAERGCFLPRRRSCHKGGCRRRRVARRPLAPTAR